MVETALGFVLGAIIGAIATMAGSYFVYRRRQQATARRIRQAFRQEIASMEHLDELAASGEYERITRSIDRPVIYETNADEIGYLTFDEASAVVDFYTGLYRLDGMEDPEDRKNEIDDVLDRRERVLRLLDENA